MHEAEAKRIKMDEMLEQLQGKWEAMIGTVHSQIDHFMTTNELEEFEARMGVLLEELTDKNK